MPEITDQFASECWDIFRLRRREYGPISSMRAALEFAFGHRRHGEGLAGATHRLLAQHVRLLNRTGGDCLVVYSDGSQGVVAAEEMVSVESVRQDKAGNADVTDAAVEVEARKIAKAAYELATFDGLHPDRQEALRNYARHVLASRQPKPMDVGRVADILHAENRRCMQNDYTGTVIDNQARVIVTLYGSPPKHAPLTEDEISANNDLSGRLGVANARIATLEADVAVLEASGKTLGDAYTRLMTMIPRALAPSPGESVWAATEAALDRALSEPPVGAIRLGRGFTDAIKDVATERQRQIEIEGWTPEHDDTNENGELASAAACYATGDTHESVGHEVYHHRAPGGRMRIGKSNGLWPWGKEWWKPSNKRRDLVKAGALILAEIERLDRAALRASATPKPDPVDWEKIAEAERAAGDVIGYDKDAIITGLVAALRAKGGV